MKLHFPALYRHERKNEPCCVSLPFARGTFGPGMRLRILEDGAERPVQTKVVSRYPDGSARWVFARFTADLPGGRAKDLEAEASQAAAPDYAGIRVVREADTIEVDGGAGGLRLTLRDGGDQLIESLWDGRTVYDGERFVGPLLKDGNGTDYSLRLDAWQVMEDGPLTAVLRCGGQFVPANGAEASGELPRFEAKLTLHAGKPWMEAAFRLINATSRPLHAASLVFALLARGRCGYDPSLTHAGRRERGDSVGEGSSAAGKVLRQADVLETTGVKLLPKLEAQLKDSPVRCCVGSSNYRTNFTVSAGSPVERLVDTDYLMSEANEHFPEVFYGTFFADRTAGTGGVCATVFQAQQNYPKAVKSDASGIYVMLVPEGAEQVVFESGMSREQRFQLHFHGPEEPLAEIDSRSLVYQMPDRPAVDPAVFREAGVCPEIFVADERRDPEVEIALISRCDAHSRSYGMLNFGDAPDMNYTRQGRGRGKLVWTNNEYDFPHACALLYMRTGERRFLDYVIAAAGHWMDVDVCHYSRDELLLGGQWEHSRRHVLDSCMVCSHQWVEGLLDLYHFTGDERALETALGIGENVRRLLETPAYQVSGESNARETGWALRALTALYVETGESKWLEKADWIVAQFREWMDAYGSWVAPYTDNTLIHVPFMIAVAMGSLMRYYRVFPRPEVKDMLLRAAEDLTEHCLSDTGLFYYKELPSLNRLGSNAMVLEALTIGWMMSGDLKYLRAGLPTFRRDIAARSAAIGEKKVMEGAVILDNDSPKLFAQSFIPLAVYYKAAAEEGLLER